MERNRIIAIACAVIATLLVVIAGKSCTDDAVKQKKSKSSSSVTTAAAPLQTTAPVNYLPYEPKGEPIETDMFGRPVSPDAQQTTVSYDLFGNPVTTASEEEGTDTAYATDENGEPITSAAAVSTETTAVTEVETDFFGFPVTTLPEEGADGESTTSVTTYPDISGFNHGDHDDKGNEIPPKPTLPPDFAIIVN